MATDNNTQPKKPKSLQEQLAERNQNLKKATEQQNTDGTTPLKKTPQQELADNEAAIKAFKTLQDLESIRVGYETFKVREAAISTTEESLKQREDELQKNIGKFAIDQQTRLEAYNAKVEQYNSAYALLQTKSKEADKLMAEALSKKSESDRIIKAQSEFYKNEQEKLEAYQKNMDEALQLFNEVARSLSRQTDSRIFSLGSSLQRDYSLMKLMLDKQIRMSTLADIIEVGCDRISELCEQLQNSKKDYSRLIQYLSSSTDWFEENLKIEWKAKEEK